MNFQISFRKLVRPPPIFFYPTIFSLKSFSPYLPFSHFITYVLSFRDLFLVSFILQVLQITYTNQKPNAKIHI